MARESNQQGVNKKMNIVNVAVAVIHYQQQYLLGFRSTEQHQGNRYEFVGGKIDVDETVKQALIREVNEETGIDIHANTLVKLGRLHHDYGDKHVCLQVYNIELTARQYEQHKHCQYGLEGQALTWVNKADLLAGKYRLPAANQTILAWLLLPSQIAVTYPLAHFDNYSDATAAWLKYHRENLAPDAWAYIRVKATDSEAIAEQLMQLRPDVHMIVPNNAVAHDSLLNKSGFHTPVTNPQVVAKHLTHSALMQWFAEIKDSPQDKSQELSQSLQSLSPSHPMIVSCHDIDSIRAANHLANTRLQHQLPPVVGMFLSPVLATQTHPNAVPLGWEQWSRLVEFADIPVIGLGGLSPKLLQYARQQGATGIAGIRQFLQS